jgi:transcriptional regulator with XRE-family HTH domain
MAKVQDPAVARRRLRMELRRARDAADLKQAQVAEAMDWSPSKLIRIESGQVGISTNDLRALLALYGVKEQRRVDGLLDLARATRGASFYDQFSDLLKPGFAEYLAYEGSASVLRQYDPVLVPGLLQTEEYARDIIENSAMLGLEAADRAWALRQHRQEVHEREDPPDMRFILDEAALRRQVGSGKVMRRQLERIREIATRRHVVLQILPFSRGAHPGMMGNFIVLEFDDATLDDLVHVESLNQITIRHDAEFIALYLERFVRLENLALDPDESMELLTKIIDELSASTGTTVPSAKAAS